MKIFCCCCICQIFLSLSLSHIVFHVIVSFTSYLIEICTMATCVWLYMNFSHNIHEIWFNSMNNVTEQLTLYSVYLKFSGLRGCCFGIANMILVSHYEIVSFSHTHTFSLSVFYLGLAWLSTLIASCNISQVKRMRETLYSALLLQVLIEIRILINIFPFVSLNKIYLFGLS